MKGLLFNVFIYFFVITSDWYFLLSNINVFIGFVNLFVLFELIDVYLNIFKIFVNFELNVVKGMF